MKNNLFISETPSTNTFLLEMLRREILPEGFVVHTNFQSAGKGQVGNSWESEVGQNLLFSMVLYPTKIPVDQLFLISQIVSLAIIKSLEKYTDGISIKWPNDIYCNDKKIAGILIENSLQHNRVKTVVGIGLNVNQKTFVSDAPNPVSLFQLTGKIFDREKLLSQICENILRIYKELNVAQIRTEYTNMLYRKVGLHNYQSDNKMFMARIVEVYSDGKLELELENGNRKGFYFKEVTFV